MGLSNVEVLGSVFREEYVVCTWCGSTDPEIFTDEIAPQHL
jgi:translation initiation factor 2 beta subunit (eIF-2beta)/eIF-5